MQFTKVQISELMRKHAEKGNGLHDLMEIMLESMMIAERGDFLQNSHGNKRSLVLIGAICGDIKEVKGKFNKICSDE